VVVIGSGYVGLVSGACFADFGHTVTCVDRDEAKVAALKNGIIPIFEPELSTLVANNMSDGRLTFTTELQDVVASADVIFIAVGTPARRGDNHADLGFVFQAARDIAGCLQGFTVVCTKSTVPVGTGDEIERIILGVNPRASVSVVSNPEFLREGSAIADFKRPDRIVIGVNDGKAREVMSELYAPLFINQAPLLFVERRAAELTKYAANAFLATKITFINEIADLCEEVGVDVQDVSRGIGLDNRIGTKFLHAGPGFGGSCFPKDTNALAKTAQDLGVPLRLVESVIAVNDQRKRGVARKVLAACGGSVRGKTIGLLGLTFKPNTDDMRDAPSISIIRYLQDNGARVKAYDPKGTEHAKSELHDVNYTADAYACIDGADALCIVTEWDQFRALDLDRVKSLLNEPVIVDLRNIYAPEEMRRRGFTYYSVGRKPVICDGRQAPLNGNDTRFFLLAHQSQPI
jgi:UDPglucose 6-dehydrogenase